MQPVERVVGRAVPLDRSDVDTDQIIPAHWLRRVERTGFGQGLFEAWRSDPSFVLNDPAREGATVLVAGPNFGIGSSREHAVWALLDYGFRAVVSARFGDIFRTNALRSGLVPALVAESLADALMEATAADPALEVVIDVIGGEVATRDGRIRGELLLDPASRDRLAQGLDDIAETLAAAADLAAYEATRPMWMPRLLGTDPAVG